MSLEIDLTPSNETIQRVREGVGLDERSMKEAVEGMKKWLELQPHLPEEDDGRLERWLIRCKNNMEKTKQTIDLYYTLKSQLPELMSNWDLDEPWASAVERQGFLVVQPKLTDDLDRMSVFGFYEDKGDFDIYSVFKMLLMSIDVRICEDYCLKEIYIIDFKYMTASTVAKFTLPAVKKFTDCALKGYKCRVRGIHIINSSPITEILITIIKSILKNKLAQRIHVYGSDYTELYNHVPRSLLPKEYGGESGPTEVLDALWKKKLRSYRDWFVENEKKKSDESKRPPGQRNNNDLFGFDGSFRQLSID